MQACTRAGEHSRDRLGKAFQPIDDGDQDVCDATLAQFRHYPQPELGALGLFDPQTKHLLDAIRPHAQRDVDRLVAHRALGFVYNCGRITRRLQAADLTPLRHRQMPDEPNPTDC
jgi:hypothetical protein